MYTFFADDSFQKTPSREGLGPTLALGGLFVEDAALDPLERGLDALCQEYQFPAGQEFKWSPGRNLWMRDGLIGDDRRIFFKKVLILATMHRCNTVVVVQDCSPRYKRAHCQSGAEEDAADLLLERVNMHMQRSNSKCRVEIDQPGGNRKNGRELTSRLNRLLQTGTRVCKLDRIEGSVKLTDSRSSRLLQLADLVTSCTCATISGEQNYAPHLFRYIRPLFLKHPWYGQIGGVGLKIHPIKFANLYHWFCDDTFIVQGKERINLPTPLKPFYLNPFQEDIGIA